MSDKPVIFISHSSKDKELALVLQEQIASVLDVDRSNVFRSTDPNAIPSGSDWFQIIQEKLNRANALVVLVTSSSMRSIWVGYEIGYFWKLYSGENIHPLIAPNALLIGPIERLQGKSLDNGEHIAAFFQALANKFDVELKGVNVSSILEVASAISELATSEWLIKKRLDEFLMNQLELYKDYNGKVVEPFGGPKLKNNVFSELRNPLPRVVVATDG